MYATQPVSVAQIRRDVAAAAASFGADDLLLLRINLAVSEAATNAVLHAYRDPSPHDEIHVLVTQIRGDITLRISDRGGGLSTPTLSPGLGLGLNLIALEADGCNIDSSPDGTQITLRFALRR